MSKISELEWNDQSNGLWLETEQDVGVAIEPPPSRTDDSEQRALQFKSRHIQMMALGFLFKS